MSQPTSPVTFEVPFTDTQLPSPPARIQKLFEETPKKDVSAEELKAKLDAAAERKKEYEKEHILRCEKRSQEVEERREQLNQKLAESQEQIKEKHDEAEQRRKALEEEKRAKLQEHLRKVEEFTSKVDYASLSTNELEAKLEAAHKRREEHEKQMLKKLAEQDQRGEEVRRRKQQLQQTESGADN
ncbi:hypothetical protein BDF19DRAFT_450542 [Syncephalis fuscata]|nr:hypothetical protein BDF19DRAFT_450542 [Syncephalis fuscata]